MSTAELDPPITSAAAALELAADVVGPAVRRSLWILLLDAERRPLRTVIPVDHLPDRPGPHDCAQLAANFARLAGEVAAAAVLLVWERPGPVTTTDRDRRWLPQLRAGFEEAGLPVAEVLISWDEGLRPADPLEG